MKEDLQLKLTGEIITKEHKDYDFHRLAWNRAINKFPKIINYCYTNEDIKNAIEFGKNEGLRIKIRSGAHHYEGYSTGDDELVIDVSRMNKIDINEKCGIVKIQGGVRNRELYKATGNLGYPFPGGGCPTVGVVGLTLGGGWGYSSRYLGIASQSLVELELINANGELVRANINENKDLFWACRGAGGGNFGVVTSMTFKLPKKEKRGTYIIIDYKNVSIEENIKILDLCQKEFKTLDNRINMKISNYNSNDKGRGVRIIGVFYGEKDECINLLNPFKHIVKNTTITLEYMDISEINREIQDSHPDYEHYKSTGRFLDRILSKDELRSIISIVDNNRPTGSIYTAVSFYGLGGKVKELTEEEGALAYMKSNFIIGLQSVWEDNVFKDCNNEWVIEEVKKIKDVTKGSFINFPLKELNNYRYEYFGENTDKLKEIKKKYDGSGVFDFEQGL
ncbi:MAG: FAD-binding protein [Clostridium sp.]